MNEEKKERKMRIVRAAVFVGIFFGALFLISFLINNFYVKGNPNVTGRQRCVAGLMNEPEETLDVIALGDSEAYTSINPMYFWKEGGVPLYRRNLFRAPEGLCHPVPEGGPDRDPLHDRKGQHGRKHRKGRKRRAQESLFDLRLS